jgi:hypothetical protein
VVAATDTGTGPAVWCYGFTDLDSGRHWLRWLLRWIPAPRHVVCYRDTAAGLLIVQQTLSRLSVTIQPGATAAGFTAEIVAAGGQVHHVHVYPDGPGEGWTPRPFCCTDIARSLASMPWRPQTPRGLARELARR